MKSILNKGLMFSLILVLILTGISTAPAYAAVTTVPAGEVSGTWSPAGSPYLVEGDITVPTGATLTIEPGVQVVFQGWYPLTVNGTLQAVGTAQDPITFTAVDKWLGIRFIDAPDGSLISYATIEKGQASGASPLDSGGGVYIQNSNPTITNSVIRDNTARRGGGGLYLVGSNAILRDNLIINNQGSLYGGTAYGGGLALESSNPELTGNTIRGNRVDVSGTYSTPSGVGGGIYALRSNPTLTRNLIADNVVSGHANSYARGGGLYLQYSDVDLVNNTITGNSATTDTFGDYSFTEGGGIYTYLSDLTIVNTILYNDTPEEIFVAANSPSLTITAAYSDVQGGRAGIVDNGNATLNQLEGNINADPRFVDPLGGDFTLQDGSPAIDAGTAFFQYGGRTLVDLASSQYTGSAPDMGAFESGGSGGVLNQPPTAMALGTPDHGSAPLSVQFSSAGSSDPDGVIASYKWDYGDGGSSSEANPTHTYQAIGTYLATLTVTDDGGASASATVSIDVVDGTTLWGGDVSGTWDLAGSPYRIEADISIPAGATLTIEPGVQVVFQGWYPLNVSGVLQAVGTAQDPITFTAVDKWLGIRFVDAPDGSLISQAIIEKGQASGASPLDSGGGVYIQNSNPTISDSIIRDNFAVRSGGGLYLTSSNAILRDNLIAGNRAGSGGTAYGGGLALESSSPELTGNTIQGNRVGVSGTYTTPSGAGGGIYANRSNPRLSRNLIADNVVSGHANSYARGGGLFLKYSDIDLVNNTITGNSATTDTFGDYSITEGGGIYTYLSDLTIVNTILYNEAPEEIFVASDSPSLTITAAYSDIQGGQAGIADNGNATLNWLEGNLDADPRFVDPLGGDFTLQDGSPAIDAGTAFFQYGGRTLVDLASGQYLGSAPDMGAIESGGSVAANQPPVALASASPQAGSAPLSVLFSSAGSYDPDGVIAAYDWDFGDGGSSSEANPLYVYQSAGSYQATLIVTDNGGASASATVAIDVSQATQAELHVGGQVVTRERDKKFERGLDNVLILDQNGSAVPGASVTVIYTGPNSGQASGLTGADGSVILATDWVAKAKGAWCFQVTQVVKDGFTYNAQANAVTMQCES